MIFYTSDEKRREMEDRVVFAVTSAVNWLEKERLEHQEEEKTRNAEVVVQLYALTQSDILV